MLLMILFLAPVMRNDFFLEKMEEDGNIKHDIPYFVLYSVGRVKLILDSQCIDVFACMTVVMIL